MSMSKMDNMCQYVGECINLSGQLKADWGEDILDALNAANTALDILSRMDLDLRTYEGRKAKELLEEWD